MNYYNEFDRKTAAWLRELIKAGLIPKGEVDDRSIADVRADDLRGFTQCHFFAGIGGWPYALRIAGWPEDREVWTGSCPCQPFSCAGKRKGKADDRHLWPIWFELIRECKPATIFGEQVASKYALAWIDGVFSDLESEAYACGAADLCAASIGAPHIRQRLFWLAESQREGSSPEQTERQSRPSEASNAFTQSGISRLAKSEHAEQPRLEGHAWNVNDRDQSRRDDPRTAGSVAETGNACGLDYTGRKCDERRGEPRRVEREAGEEQGQTSQRERGRDADCDTITTSFWAGAIWHLCRDGKARRIPNGIKPVLQRVVDGFPGSLDNSGAISDAANGFPLAQGIRGRIGLLKGYGNAIVPELAAEFVKAFLDL
jgi:DNA (cytosine-5)-methyltransferase 1